MKDEDGIVLAQGRVTFKLPNGEVRISFDDGGKTLRVLSMARRGRDRLVVLPDVSNVIHLALVEDPQ